MLKNIIKKINQRIIDENSKKQIKKAFTLVELLAVIFIIGIVSVIVVPTVGRLMRQSREELYQTQMDNIEEGVKSWSSTYPTLLPENDGEQITLTLGQLKKGGFVQKDIKDPRNRKLFPNDMEIVVHRVMNSYKYEIIENSGGVDDEIDYDAPTIVLNGLAHEIVEINSYYNEKGAEARDPNGVLLDNIDIVIKLNDKTVSNIETNKLTQYKVIYTVTHDGRSSSVVRTVSIKDTIPPVLTIPSNITIFDEEVASFDFMEGVKTSDNSLGDVSVEVKGNLSTMPGQYLITYIAKDPSGNETKKTRYITVISASHPEIVLKGNNPLSIYVDTSYMEPGFTAHDKSEGNLTNKVLINTNINPSRPGTYNVTYSVTNKFGNTTTVVRTIYVVDNIPPVIAFEPNGNSKYARNHSTKVIVTDAHSIVDNQSLKYLWSTSTSTPKEGDFTNTFTNNGTINTPRDVTGDYYLWIKASDVAGNTKIQRTNVFKLNNTAPTLNLLGQNPMTVNVGTSYKDPGATATDAIDGNITSNITTSGTINMNVIGSYKITYTVKNSAGTVSTATRTVNVVDNIPPVISFSPNGNSTYKQNHNTKVTVTDAHSGVDNGNLRYLWHVSTTTPNEQLFTNSFTNESNLSLPSNQTGTYYLWIKALDKAGNTSIQRSNAFNLDNVKPVITLTGSSSMTINRGSTFQDPGATASDNIDGNITNKIIVSGSVNINKVGTYTITYNVSDSAGNVATPVKRTVVVIDSEAPVITIKGSNPAIVNVGTSYKDEGATAIDDVDGDVTNNITTSGTVNINIPGTYTITYTVSDSAGNKATAKRTVNVVDNIPPVISFGTNGNSTYKQSHSTKVTVTDAHSKVNTSSLKYLWSTSTSTPSVSSFTINFNNNGTISTPTGVSGNYYLWILAEDTAGNRKIQRSNVFRLDNTKPVITLNGDSIVTLNVGGTYTDAGATATDNVDGNITSRITTSGTININIPGTYTITYTVSDTAGNKATAKRTVNVVDNVPPVISFSSKGNSTYKQSHSTKVTVTDTHSNVNTSSLKYLWSTSTSTPSEGSFSSSFVNGNTIVTPSGASGRYYLWILAKDSVGNTSIERSNAFNLDNIPPVITLKGSANMRIDLGSSFMDPGVTVTDNVDTNIVATATGTVNVNVPGSYKITYKAADSSGNYATPVVRTVIVADNTAPVITLKGSNPVLINVGTTYVDAGATAMDDVDGDITHKIAVTGTVNVNRPGNYTITYKVSDSSNNQTTATRTVMVIDNVPPVINFDTTGNTTYARSRSVKVSVTDAHSSVNNASLKFVWSTSMAEPIEAVFTSPFNNNANIMTPSNVTGKYYLWVIAKDTAGNVAKKRTNAFYIDNTPPEVTFTHSNNYNTYARSHDVTVSILDEHSDLGSLYYLWTNSTSTPSRSDFVNKLSAKGTKLTTPSNVTGIYYLWISAEDEIGNVTTTRSVGFRVADTGPTIKVDPNGSCKTSRPPTPIDPTVPHDPKFPDLGDTPNNYFPESLGGSDCNYKPEYEVKVIISSPVFIPSASYGWVKTGEENYPLFMLPANGIINSPRIILDESYRLKIIATDSLGNKSTFISNLYRSKSPDDPCCPPGGGICFC